MVAELQHLVVQELLLEDRELQTLEVEERVELLITMVLRHLQTEELVVVE